MRGGDGIDSVAMSDNSNGSWPPLLFYRLLGTGIGSTANRHVRSAVFNFDYDRYGRTMTYEQRLLTNSIPIDVSSVPALPSAKT